jgi:uncharacterized protein (UPF0333 family)
MNVRKSAALVILLVIVVLAASIATFVSTSPASKGTYQEPASAVHASLGETVSDGTIGLRLNSISDASNPTASSAWITLNVEAHENGVYRFSLTPPPGDSYLIANVTVTNVHHTEIPFEPGDFVLIARDGTAYYANYAVCNTGCSAQALVSRALNETFTSDVYVLFSVPTATQPTQIAYTGATPPIVMSST